MATGDQVNHRCGRASEVFLDKVGVICLVSKSFDIANNLTMSCSGRPHMGKCRSVYLRRALRICSRARGQEVPQVPWVLVGNQGQIRKVLRRCGFDCSIGNGSLSSLSNGGRWEFHLQTRQIRLLLSLVWRLELLKIWLLGIL